MKNSVNGVSQTHITVKSRIIANDLREQMKKISLVSQIVISTFSLILVGCFALNSNDPGYLSGEPTLTHLYPVESTIAIADLNSSTYPIDNVPFYSNGGLSTTPLIVVPTPASGKFVVFGQMLTPGVGGKPYVGDLYLARLVKANESNQPPLIKFSESDDPKAVVDAGGCFYFDNINPGEYALILFSLGGTIIITDKDGEVIYVTGDVDGSIDLGIIEIP